MGLSRTIRRFHAPILCVLIACLVSAGCKRGAWSEERYTFNHPQDAYVAEDGTLLLSVYVNRKYKKSEDGWHWVIVDPEKTQALFDAATSATLTEEDAQAVFQSQNLHWRGDVSIELWPSIRSSGLPHADPPEGYAGLVPWEVEPMNNGRVFELYSPGEADAPALRLQVVPSSYERETVFYQALQVVAAPLLIPAVVFGVVALSSLLVYWAIFGGPDWGF